MLLIKNFRLQFCLQTYCRDVLQDGFPVENSADAVFLDIPQPDQAISLAAKALKKSGKFDAQFLITFGFGI